MDHLCQKNIGKDPFQWNEKGPDKDMFTLPDHYLQPDNHRNSRRWHTNICISWLYPFIKNPALITTNLSPGYQRIEL
jgi:hypothetical protein